MKTISLISLLLLLAQPFQDDDAIAGTWKMSENNTEIEISRDGDVHIGTVVKSDIEKAIGKEVLKDLKKEDGVWKGKFYVVRRDRLVDATLKETGDQILEMEIKAGPRTKTLNLTKAE